MEVLKIYRCVQDCLGFTYGQIRHLPSEITPSMVMELVSGGVYRVYRTVFTLGRAPTNEGAVNMFWPCSTVSDFLVCVIILMSSCWIICHKSKMCLKTMFIHVLMFFFHVNSQQFHLQDAHDPADQMMVTDGFCLL